MGHRRREFTPEFKEEVVKLVVNTGRAGAASEGSRGSEDGSGVCKKSVTLLRPGSVGYERKAFELMRVEKNNFTITRMARLLEVSRSGFSAWLGRRPSNRATRTERIEQKVVWFHGDSDEVSGSPKILADLVEDALTMAITLRDGLPEQVVFHTDKGTQCASTQISNFASANGITRSMGRTGVCWDNAMAESFFATLKTEFYYRRVWPTMERAKLEVGAWIEGGYNRPRRHASLGQISPVSFELQCSNQIAELQQAA